MVHRITQKKHVIVKKVNASNNIAIVLLLVKNAERIVNAKGVITNCK